MATEIFVLSLAYDEIRKKPAADDVEDVWEREGHQVTLAVLNAHAHPAKPAAHAAPAHPKTLESAAPAKTPPPIAPEFDQTLIADNLLSMATGGPAEEADHWSRRVQVSLGDHQYTWDTSGVPFTMGRDRSSSVFLTSEYASRLHARIEIRDGVVFLIDQSSNGTYVTLTGEKETLLKKGEMQLQPASSGVLSFGISKDQATGDLAYFTIR